MFTTQYYSNQDRYLPVYCILKRLWVQRATRFGIGNYVSEVESTAATSQIEIQIKKNIYLFWTSFFFSQNMYYYFFIFRKNIKSFFFLLFFFLSQWGKNIHLISTLFWQWQLAVLIVSKNNIYYLKKELIFRELFASIFIYPMSF